MLKHIKNLLERNAYALAIVLTVLIVYLSLSTTPKVLGVVNVSDKALHLIAYFVLSSSWFFAVKLSHNKIKVKLIVGFLVLILSILLEFLQGSITNHRTMDYFDIVANGFGIIFAIISFRWVMALYRII